MHTMTGQICVGAPCAWPQLKIVTLEAGKHTAQQVRAKVAESLEHVRIIIVRYD